jgi:hypothetical protein
MAPDVAAAVAERIRRPQPAGLSVLSGSLPVVSFGDASSAVAATVSLNPSWREFLSPSGAWLRGADRRLASLISLNAADPRDLDDDQVASVVSESNRYFRGPNWYRQWFHWLESTLTSAGAGSYLDGTACHLDLVQWATRPAQGQLPPAAWDRLAEQDSAFLHAQLRASSIKTVLLNGAAVIEWIRRTGLVSDFVEDMITYQGAEGTGTIRVVHAAAESRLFLGWNRPLASAIVSAIMKLSSEGRAAIT